MPRKLGLEDMSLIDIQTCVSIFIHLVCSFDLVYEKKAQRHLYMLLVVQFRLRCTAFR